MHSRDKPYLRANFELVYVHRRVAAVSGRRNIFTVKRLDSNQSILHTGNRNFTGPDKTMSSCVFLCSCIGAHMLAMVLTVHTKDTEEDTEVT
jgi:hypothetical protein